MVNTYVATTYRLTEHHTAGGMSRWQPYLAELQPEFFCEVSPGLAAERGLEHTGWATIVSARGVIEARVHPTRVGRKKTNPRNPIQRNCRTGPCSRATRAASFARRGRRAQLESDGL